MKIWQTLSHPLEAMEERQMRGSEATITDRTLGAYAGVVDLAKGCGNFVKSLRDLTATALGFQGYSTQKAGESAGKAMSQATMGVQSLALGFFKPREMLEAHREVGLVDTDWIPHRRIESMLLEEEPFINDKEFRALKEEYASRVESWVENLTRDEGAKGYDDVGAIRAVAFAAAIEHPDEVDEEMVQKWLSTPAADLNQQQRWAILQTLSLVAHERHPELDLDSADELVEDILEDIAVTQSRITLYELSSSILRNLEKKEVALQKEVSPEQLYQLAEKVAQEGTYPHSGMAEVASWVVTQLEEEPNVDLAKAFLGKKVDALSDDEWAGLITEMRRNAEVNYPDLSQEEISQEWSKVIRDDHLAQTAYQYGKGFFDRLDALRMTPVHPQARMMWYKTFQFEAKDEVERWTKELTEHSTAFGKNVEAVRAGAYACYLQREVQDSFEIARWLSTPLSKLNEEERVALLLHLPLIVADLDSPQDLDRAEAVLKKVEGENLSVFEYISTYLQQLG